MTGEQVAGVLFCIALAGWLLRDLWRAWGTSCPMSPESYDYNDGD